MSDDNQVIDTQSEVVTESPVVDTAIDNQDTQTDNTSDAESKVKQLMAELEKANQVLEKARKGEKYAKSQKDKAVDIAKADLDAKYAEELNAIKSKLSEYETKEKQAVITNALSEVGAIDIKAVSKLIGDVTPDNVDKAVKQAMTDYPALFAQKQTPPTPNRSVEGLVTTSLEAELALAAKQTNYRQAVDAVYVKYGITARK